ncbi:MAG TPA: SCO family protein [bacterium]|nr:SCO family protein [bacterium]
MKRIFAGALLIFCFLGCQRKELPVLGQIPEFKLTSQEAKPFTHEEMKGKVWVADFIFTSCGGACPLMTERMKKSIQASLLDMKGESGEPPAKILSFSVDPERDTPEVLAQYAKDHGAEPGVWVFLTGPLDEITRTVVQGFKISMGKVPSQAPNQDEIWEVVHGEQFLLIDRQGRIRGYYSSEGSDLRRLLADLKFLVQGGAS